MQDYRSFKVWEKAHALTLQVYKISLSFPKEETYGLTSQLKRSVISVPANIAEGAGRNTRPDFAQFLNIALGSLNESSYYILLAKELGYLNDDDYTILDKEVNGLKAMLITFINTVRKSAL
ncbi:MAG: four helix bundle protein [Prevotella sp.]|jgi:four helix bundle protein|nr:four helix bundle protein [Prevotella sp.]